MSGDLIDGFVTVRATSSRLPGKCFLPFGDGTVLEHVVQRAQAFDVDPIVCTSVDPADDRIADLAARHGVRCFRGSMVNKLKRWADCAAFFRIDRFHTVDADDPFFDGRDIRRSMQLLDDEDLDVVAPTVSSSSGGATVGYSLKTEIVQRAVGGLDDSSDTEMMWHYLERVPGVRITTLSEAHEPVQVRLTLDYEEDYWLLESVRRMVGNLAPRDVIDDLFRTNPDLYKVNWFRNQEWKEGQLAKKPSLESRAS
jgi:spore coat polysaccharide biosynthesis protein SpsF